MVQELRASQADVDARRHFTPEKEPIRDARYLITEWSTPKALAPRRTASSFKSAAESGFVEMG